VTESLDSTFEHESIEALIRSAKNYVRASDDLRPQVLETARVRRRDFQFKWRLWLAAVMVSSCGWLMASVLRKQDVESGPTFPTVTSAGQLVVGVEVAAPSTDTSWQIVESFTQLRLKQARLLRM
jgi:hypothetical protein